MTFLKLGFNFALFNMEVVVYSSYLLTINTLIFKLKLIS